MAKLSAPPGPGPCSFWSIFYVRYQCSGHQGPVLVLSDDPGPGAGLTTAARVPADSGSHHNIKSGQWDNSTWHKQSHWDTETPPAHPQQHDAPPGDSERPRLDSLIFNGLMRTLIFPGWTRCWISIFNSLNWKIGLGLWSPGVHFPWIFRLTCLLSSWTANIFCKFIGIKLDVNSLSLFNLL